MYVDGVAWMYMSLDTFEDMLMNQQVWFSHADTLNDPRERLFAFEVFRTLLGRALDSRPLIGTWREEVESATRWLDNDDDLRPLTPFSASFSRDGDNLLCWSMYADSLRGVSVGFDQSALLPALEDARKQGDAWSAWRFSPEDVLYGRREAETALAPVVDSVIDSVVRLARGGGAAVSWGYDDSFRQVSEVASRFKTDGWRQEEEWRVVCRLAAPLRAAGEVVREESPFRAGQDGQPSPIKIRIGLLDVVRAVVAGPLVDLSRLREIAEGHECGSLVRRSPTEFRRR